MCEICKGTGQVIRDGQPVCNDGEPQWCQCDIGLICEIRYVQERIGRRETAAGKFRSQLRAAKRGSTAFKVAQRMAYDNDMALRGLRDRLRLLEEAQSLAGLTEDAADLLQTVPTFA